MIAVSRTLEHRECVFVLRSVSSVLTARQFVFHAGCEARVLNFCPVISLELFTVG